MQQEPDLRPEPAENGDADEEELAWEGDPDDLLGVLVEVKDPSPDPV